MADIFDEINEELKQDRMTALWQRYRKYVIADAVVAESARHKVSAIIHKSVMPVLQTCS